MKISDMAVNNIKGNLHRYIMYYLSNSFAVTVFFIFANFVFHPSLDTNNISESVTAQQGVASGLIASQVIIVVFSVLFVGYSTSIFLKSRGKEFGLLSLYGMTKRQIKKYVLIENTIISFISIGTGILTGVLFSKLFFMAMEVFLNTSLSFNISFKALGLTAIIFLALFEIISIIMLFQIKNKEIIQQLKSSKIPKTIPKFSKFKSILGVLLIVIGYSIAWFVPPMGVVLAMLPVIFIVIVGTYFIFTQFSIAIANGILKNENMLYKKSNLVSYSQMIHKLQDTSKVLFLAAILGAFTFTATETVYSFYTEIPRMAGINTPQEMAIAQRGEALNDDSIIKNVKDTLDKNNLKIKEIHEVKGVVLYSVEKEGNTSEFFALSNTDYNKLAKSLGKEEIEVKENELVYNYPYEEQEESMFTGYGGVLDWKEIKLNIGEEVREFKLSKEIHGGVMALNNVRYFNAIILNDKDFEIALEKADKNNIVKYNGIRLDDWEDSYKASIEIEKQLNTGENLRYYSKIIPYEEMKKSFGLVLFIGFFIAFLFFIASGSIIYFKLFNEIKNDGIEYNILRKIGTTKKEINKIITKQIAIIFFLPFVVSTLHSFFALKSLSTLLMRSLFVNGVVVMVGYLVFQIIYFLIIRGIYISQIRYE